MLKNFAVLAGGGAGVAAAGATWYVLDRWDSSAYPPEWLGVWSYGLALGCAATITCAATGGRSLAECVEASALGAGLATATVATLAVVMIAHELPAVALPFVALYLVLWVGAIATIVLIAPALVVTLALLGAAWIARRVRVTLRMP